MHHIEHEVVDALDRASLQQDAYCCRLYSIFVPTPLGELSSKEDSVGTIDLAGRKPLPLSGSVGRGGSHELCMTVDQNCPLDNAIIIPGGKFAIFSFEGLIQDIFAAFQGVFTVWLPESGYVMRESYGLDIYRNINRESMRVVMDLGIPIK